MTTENENESALPTVYHVPASVEEMLPTKARDLITEAAIFLRTHWDEVRPYYEAIAGERPSLHGSLRFDEAACTFKVQDMAKANGYAMLGEVNAAQLWRALRYGYRRNTGVTVTLLEKQNRRLRLEFKAAAE